MTRLLAYLISGPLLVPLVAAALHAQTPSTEPNSEAPATTNPTPSAQAPDEMTAKISDLVHAGKYADAQQLTAGLLVAYPNDQRLIKAQALIEKLLAASSKSAPVGGGPAPAAAAAQPEAPPLTGMDRVDYNALIELARQAQEAKDVVEQYRLMGQFMGQSIRFLQKHPDQMLLWQLRAAIAIAANQPKDGYEAGQRLLAAGAADSNDPAVQQLLGQLKNKGWLDRSTAMAADRAAQMRRVGLMYSGVWYGRVASPNNRSPMAGCTDADINHKCLFYTFVDSDQGGKIHPFEFEIQSDGTIVVSDHTPFAGCNGSVYGIPVGPSFKDVRWEIRPAGLPPQQIFSGYVEDGSQFGFSCNRPQSGDYKKRYNYVIWVRTLEAAQQVQDQRRK